MPLRRFCMRVPTAPIVDRDEVLDVLVIFVTLNMGGWFLLDYFEGWNTFRTAPFFHLMAPVATEWWWGAAFFLIGSVHLWGFLREQIAVRRASAFLSFLLWMFVWSLTSLSNPHSPTVGVYTAFWVGSGAICLRLRKEGPADFRAGR